MKNKIIEFQTRGDDIKRLNEAIDSIPHDNEILLSYLCYLRLEMSEQLNTNLSKEDYPIGHSKGFIEQEFNEYIERS